MSDELQDFKLRQTFVGLFVGAKSGWDINITLAEEIQSQDDENCEKRFINKGLLTEWRRCRAFEDRPIEKKHLIYINTLLHFPNNLFQLDPENTPDALFEGKTDAASGGSC